MLMAFPFLVLDDIDDVWDEMKDTCPDMGDLDNLKLEKFITYFEDTWVKENCHFDRSVWNLFEVYSSRTNNISETYNHAINGQVMSSKSNVYKILDITKNQETLTSTKFERVNQGQEKKSSNAQHVKDAKIEVLKLKYKHGELDVMDSLLQASVFSKNSD
jgi:hypothetical protein